MIPKPNERQVSDLFWPSLVLLALALVMRLASSSLANLSYLVLAVFALAGNREVILALAMSWLFTVLSPGVAPAADAATVGRFAVLAAAALSIILHSPRTRGGASSSSGFSTATMGMGGLIIVHSAFFSPHPDVSILKAFSWTTALVTLSIAWRRLTPTQLKTLEILLFGGLIVIFALSLPLALIPLGRLRNGTGLQGILNHPQAFGPFIALLGAWVGGRLLSTPHPPLKLFVLMAACLVAVVLSEARTAGAALALSISLTILLGPTLAKVPRLAYMPAMASPRVHSLVLGGAVAVAFVGGALSTVLGDYVSKRTEAGNLLEAAERSRGGMVDTMITNIERDPWTGIGFGIASEPLEMVVERDTILGFPTSASVEKGVLPVAVVEELGVFMGGLVAFWAIVMMRRSAISGPQQFAVCLAAILCNLGEATLFSPGGYGLLPLVLIAWAVTASRMPNRQPMSRPGISPNSPKSYLSA